MGTQEQGLYCLFFEVIRPSIKLAPTSTKTAFTASALGLVVKKDATKPLEIWHKRLGHVNYSMIR
jgi:hypothetical protein